MILRASSMSFLAFRSDRTYSSQGMSSPWLAMGLNILKTSSIFIQDEI
jgi:hypothetical protein